MLNLLPETGNIYMISNNKKQRLLHNTQSELRVWLDSGANIHVVHLPLQHFKHVSQTKLTLNTAATGTIECNWKGTLGPIRDVHQSNEVTTNLMSVSKLCTDYNCIAVFTATKTYVYKQNTIETHDDPIWEGHVHNGMYLLNIPFEEKQTISTPFALVVDAVVVNSYTNWHKRLNHSSQEYMRKLQLNYPHMKWTKKDEISHHTTTCIGCVKGKLVQKAHFSNSKGLAGVIYPVNKPGDLILIDMYFSNLPSRENHYVGIIIVDAYSKCIFSLTANNKAEDS